MPRQTLMNAENPATEPDTTLAKPALRRQTPIWLFARGDRIPYSGAGKAELICGRVRGARNTVAS